MAVSPNCSAGTTFEITCPEISPRVPQDCCLVQICPADVFDGMLQLEQDRIVIGRDQSSDFCLKDASVSRQHAEILRNENGFEIVDLCSTNRTIVNGKPIERHQLHTGDGIKIGTFLFRFLESDSSESTYHQTVYAALTMDELTGAYNKSYLLDNLSREIARSQRHDRPLAVVMIDIDRFKQVNDTRGHLVGDEVLKELGRRLAKVHRDDDLFARYGGEEFCLLMPDTGPAEACEVAERCRRAISKDSFRTESGPLAITASFGVAVLTDGAECTAVDLVRAADDQLYAAKYAGRNCVRIRNNDKSPIACVS